MRFMGHRQAEASILTEEPHRVKAVVCELGDDARVVAWLQVRPREKDDEALPGASRGARNMLAGTPGNSSSLAVPLHGRVCGSGQYRRADWCRGSRSRHYCCELCHDKNPPRHGVVCIDCPWKAMTRLSVTVTEPAAARRSGEVARAKAVLPRVKNRRDVCTHCGSTRLPPWHALWCSMNLPTQHDVSTANLPPGMARILGAPPLRPHRHGLVHRILGVRSVQSRWLRGEHRHPTMKSSGQPKHTKLNTGCWVVVVGLLLLGGCVVGHPENW